MQYLTNKIIKEKLESVQNRFNEYNFSDDILLSDILFIMHNRETGKKLSRHEKEMRLDMIIDKNYRELVKEYEHVVISKGKYGMHYIQQKGLGGRLYHPIEMYVSERLETKVEDVYKTAEEMNQIYTEKCHTSQVEFPTGNILFTNFFKNATHDDYAFEMPDDLKYTSRYSINNDIGIQRTMQKLSEVHGLGYVQFGNTSADVYKVSDDKIVICPTFAEYEDEDGKYIDVPVPEDWERLGEVCCDVWRVEFIDQQNFDKGDTLPIDHEEYDWNKPFTGKVNPGTWIVKNSYHFISDEHFINQGQFPIWCELTRQI